MPHARRAVSAAVLAGLAVSAMHGAAVAQSAPSDADRPAELCGLSAPSATALLNALRVEPGLRALPANPRFEIFSSVNQREQWVATRPGEAAHPAVTCRQAIVDPDNGQLALTRAMRCDGPAPACAALRQEFAALDEGVRAQIAQRRSRN